MHVYFTNEKSKKRNTIILYCSFQTSSIGQMYETRICPLSLNCLKLVLFISLSMNKMAYDTDTTR